MSSALQLPMFDSSATTVRAAAGVHALSVPARTFTGDFYFVERSAAPLWFAVGDVAGKGVGAAVFMAMIREELDGLAARCRALASDPVYVAAELDALLHAVLPRNRFASAVIGSIDGEGTLRVVNAGHCPLLIARADGRIEAIESTGPVLGILDGAAWRSATIDLAPGETILAYSDGVIEAERGDGEEYGVERLGRAFASIVQRESDPERIARAIEGDVRRFAGSFSDDLTIVIVRCPVVSPGASGHLARTR